MEIAYLSLGTNLGDRIGNLRAAITRLRTVGGIRSVSSVYETEPLEFVDQPWFLNAVVAIETPLAPRLLLQRALEIEREMGRERTIAKGPRLIDIDILLFGGKVVNEADLDIPHPGMHRRRFVLEPLAEIAPDVRHPVLNKTALELLRELHEPSAVRRWSDPISG